MKFFGFNKTNADVPESVKEYVKLKVRTLNRSELVARVSEGYRMRPADVNALLEGFLDVIAGELKAGNAVRISGFGKFNPKRINRKNWRNPQTGKNVSSGEKKSVSFRASRGLKDSLS